VIEAAPTSSPSEERCARAFESWVAEWELRPVQRMLLWNGWQACWKHLQREYEEYVSS
jgi:hypothetical protein